MLGDHAIPIRSWVLHAFHENAGHWRSPPGTHGVRDLGPVPCACLQQLVAAPFLLERTRLQYMRGLVVRCAELPPGVSLAAFVERPVPGVWRHFSFAAAHDALRLGVVSMINFGNNPFVEGANATVLDGRDGGHAAGQLVVEPTEVAGLSIQTVSV